MTEETLQIIEDCGAAVMPIGETCLIAEIAEADYFGDEIAQKRYRKGLLKTRFAVRQAVVKLAKAGNPQALKTYDEMLAETTSDSPENAKSDDKDPFSDL